MEFEHGMTVAMERMGYRRYTATVKHPWREWDMEEERWTSGDWSKADFFVPNNVLGVPTRFESLGDLVGYLKEVKGRDGECFYPEEETFYLESIR